jgi:hypothetical protein
MSRKKAVTIHPARLMTAEELAVRIKRDETYPPSFRWLVETSRNVHFTDETAEGATALARQFFKGHL